MSGADRKVYLSWLKQYYITNLSAEYCKLAERGFHKTDDEIKLMNEIQEQIKTIKEFKE